MAHRLLLLSIVVLLSPLWLGSMASPAFAQDAAAISQARADFQRAVELEQARDFAGALRLFRRVGQVKMTPQVRYHIATCEENLGRMVAALGGYRLALRDSAGMHPGFIQEVQESVEYLERRIPKLIVARGEGAEAAVIELDGIQLGARTVGTEIPLDPGPHTVAARAPSKQEFSTTITVSEGEVEELVVDLTPVPSETPVAPVATKPPPPAEDAKPRGYGLAPYITAGAGAAVIITGGVLLGVSQGKVGRAREICGGTDCSSVSGDELAEAQGLVASAQGLETAGWVMMGLGVSGVIAGTILYFTNPARKAPQERSRVRVLGAAARAELGLSLVGTF